MPAVYDPEKTDEISPTVPEQGDRANVADLEDNFNTPSNPENHHASNDIGQLENAYGATSATSGEQPDLYKSGGGSKNPAIFGLGKMGRLYGKMTPLQKRGGVVGIIIGLVLMVLSTVSLGPLQFVHMSQLLERFHFTSTEDMKGDRFTKITRYLHHRTTQDTRLGYFANKYAVNIETKMKKAGITLEYNNVDGKVKSRVYDFDKLEKSPIGNEIPKGEVERVRWLQDTYGEKNIAMIGKNKFRVKEPDSGIVSIKKVNKIKALNKLGLKAGGYNSKILTGIAARKLKARQGVTYHPINRIDREFNAKRNILLTNVLKGLKEKFTKGNPGNISSLEAKPSKDSNGNEGPPSQEAKDAANEGEKVKTSAKEDPVGFKNKIGKGAVGVAFITAFLCIVKDINDNLANINSMRVLMPMVQLGTAMLAVGNQVMSNQDIDMDSLDALSTLMYDKETGSWQNAKSIQSQLGNGDKGVDLPPDAQLTMKDNAITKLFEKPGIKQGANTVCSEAAQGVMLVAGFVVAPVFSAIVEVFMLGVGNDLAGRLINGVTGQLANEALDVTKYKGGEFGAVVDAGAFLSSNETAKTDGGRPLTKAESIALRESQNTHLASEYKNKSIFDKYFNVYDANTVAAKIIDNQSPDMGQNIAKFPVKMFGTLMSSIKNLGSMYDQKSFAIEGYYDYGLPEIGFSQNEINSSLVENPLQNADNAMVILKGPNGDKYKTFFKECYGINLNDDLSSTTDQNVSILYEGDDGLLEKSSGGIKCTEPTDDNLQKIRMAIFDTNTMEAAACLDGDEEACNKYFGPISNADQQAATNNILYMTGDSYGDGLVNTGKLQSKLDNKGWNATINYEIGRSFAAGLSQLKTDQNEVSQAGAVVIQLGTNNYSNNATSFNSGLKEIYTFVKRIAPNAQIYWVNYAVRSGTEWDQSLKAKNILLQRFADNNEIKIIDWAKESSRADYSGEGDGLHPNANGYKHLANLIVESVGVPSTTGGINKSFSWAKDTSNIPCDSRTKDLGVAEGWHKGEKHKIRLCLLKDDPNMDINSQISGNVFELVKAAKADGVTLKASSAYRDMATQIRLRKDAGCDPYVGDCGGMVAKAGWSNHQMGAAIDFSNCGYGMPTSEGRKTQCYIWLSKHASEYGLMNYPRETWHWSVNGG